MNSIEIKAAKFNLFSLLIRRPMDEIPNHDLELIGALRKDHDVQITLEAAKRGSIRLASEMTGAK